MQMDQDKTQPGGFINQTTTTKKKTSVSYKKK